LVDYTEQNPNVLTNSNPFNLSPGIPAGGTYSGDGIIGTSFHPTLAGPGPHVITYTFTDANGCTQSDSSLINVVSGAGLWEFNFDQWSIHPNPTQNDLTISLPPSFQQNNYSIQDATGRIVQNGLVGPGSNLISTKQLPAGSYFIKLNYSIKKFIKI
jgi:hypothetical protein